MTKTRIAGALLMALFSVSVAAQAPATAPKADAGKAAAAAKPQGKALYSKDIFDYFLKQRTAQGQPDSPELREALREELNTRELLLKEAKKAGVDKKPDVKTEVQLGADMVMIRAFLNQWVEKNPVPDEVLRKEYDAMKAQMGDKEYKVSHVLVEKEDDAKAIIADLQKGKKFADIAKEKSKDPGSKDKGGDLGWNAPGTFVKPFADAIPTVEKGKYTTTPVQSQYGWHVIMVEDVREAKVPSFDEVKPQLQQRAQAQWMEKYFKELRQKAGA